MSSKPKINTRTYVSIKRSWELLLKSYQKNLSFAFSRFLTQFACSSCRCCNTNFLARLHIIRSGLDSDNWHTFIKEIGAFNVRTLYKNGALRRYDDILKGNCTNLKNIIKGMHEFSKSKKAWEKLVLFSYQKNILIKVRYSKTISSPVIVIAYKNLVVEDLQIPELVQRFTLNTYSLTTTKSPQFYITIRDHLARAWRNDTSGIISLVEKIERLIQYTINPRTIVNENNCFAVLHAYDAAKEQIAEAKNA